MLVNKKSQTKQMFQGSWRLELWSICCWDFLQQCLNMAGFILLMDIISDTELASMMCDFFVFSFSGFDLWPVFFVFNLVHVLEGNVGPFTESWLWRMSEWMQRNGMDR